MEYLWYVVGCGFGLAVSLYFGRLLSAITANWESATVAVETHTTVFGGLLGGGSLAAYWIFAGQNAAVFYILGLAVGLVYTFFYPRMPGRYTLESVRNCVVTSELIRDKVPSIENRVYLIATQFASIKSLARQAKISESEVEEDLSKALDIVSNSITRENDKL